VQPLLLQQQMKTMLRSILLLLHEQRQLLHQQAMQAVQVVRKTFLQ
jgi:hypothetical protein